MQSLCLASIMIIISFSFPICQALPGWGLHVTKWALPLGSYLLPCENFTCICASWSWRNDLACPLSLFLISDGDDDNNEHSLCKYFSAVLSTHVSHRWDVFLCYLCASDNFTRWVPLFLFYTRAKWLPQDCGDCSWQKGVPASESASHSVVSDSLQPQRLYGPWNSPGQNTGVGSLSLPQGTFPTYKSNWGLLHRSPILYQLSYQGSRKECLAYCCAVLQNLGLHFFHCMASHTTEHAAWSDNSEEMGTRQCKEMSPVRGLTSSEHIPLSLGHSEEALLWRKWGLRTTGLLFTCPKNIYQSPIFMSQLLWRILYFERGRRALPGQGELQVGTFTAYTIRLMKWGDLRLDINIFKRLLAGNVKKSLFSSCYTKDRAKNRAKHNTLTDPLVMKMKSQNLASKWRKSRQSGTK